jgi:integrase/recombinase XerD
MDTASMDTVADAVQRWLRERYASGDITSRTRTLLECRFPALLAVCGPHPVGSLDRATLRVWAMRIGHLSPATRRAYLSTVGGFCRWCVDEGLLGEDPTRHLHRVKEPKRVPRARQAAEIRLLLATAHTCRERAIIVLMVGMGLRSCEVATADLDCYDRTAATLLLRGKGGDERLLPVPEFVAAGLNAYRDEIGWWPGPLVCTALGGRRLMAPSVAQIVSRRMRECGIKRYGGDGVTPHTVRHTALSDVLDRCGNVRTVQEMAGHASLATTAIYLRRASLGQLREAMEGRDYSLA